MGRECQHKYYREVSLLLLIHGPSDMFSLLITVLLQSLGLNDKEKPPAPQAPEAEIFSVVWGTEHPNYMLSNITLRLAVMHCVVVP